MAKKNKKETQKTITINAPIDIELGSMQDSAEVLLVNTSTSGTYVWLLIHDKDEDNWFIECVEHEELSGMESLDELSNDFKLVFDSKEELVLFYQALNKWVGKNG